MFLISVCVVKRLNNKLLVSRGKNVVWMDIILYLVIKDFRIGSEVPITISILIPYKECKYHLAYSNHCFSLQDNII